MTYEYFKNHIGKKADIIKGDLVLSETGFLTVSTSPLINTIYVDRFTNSALPICTKESYLGRTYRITQSDCLTLYTEWHDKEKGTDLKSKLKRISRKIYVANIDSNIHSIILDNGFKAIPYEDVILGDMIICIQVNHAAVYLGNNKILHIRPSKYSCIDTLDWTTVTGAYRYGN